MSSERRKQYRVSVSDVDGIELRVATGSGDRFEGELLDLTADGAGMRFPHERAPALGLGQKIAVTLTAAWLKAPVRMPGVVRQRTEQTKFRRYGVEFVLAGTEEIPKDLHRLLNRRSAVRVSPPPDAPIETKISTSTGFGAPAILVDISATGVAIGIPIETDAPLSGDETVEISLRLPTTGRSVDLVASIRDRRLVQGQLRLGLMFAPELSTDFGRQTEEITGYIMARQRELLSERTELRESPR